MSTNTRIGHATRWPSALDKLVAETRAGTCIDPRVPLGHPGSMRPELGPSAVAYFAAKHARGEFGKYFPLHVCEIWKGKLQ